MKKGVKNNEYASSGLHLIEVFHWEVPKHLEEKYKEFKKAQANG